MKLLSKSKGAKKVSKKGSAAPLGKPVLPAQKKVVVPSIPLPGDLKKKLLALRARYWRVNSMVGICMLISAISLLCFAQTVADWEFDVPWAARAMFLGIDIAILSKVEFGIERLGEG